MLSDASLIGTPHQWGLTVKAAAETQKADTVVIEDNQGGQFSVVPPCTTENVEFCLSAKRRICSGTTAIHGGFN
ncbi:MAG: hypothetical protein ACTTJ7_08970 [Treponema sp.]